MWAKMRARGAGVRVGRRWARGHIHPVIFIRDPVRIFSGHIQRSYSGRVGRPGGLGPALRAEARSLIFALSSEAGSIRLISSSYSLANVLVFLLQRLNCRMMLREKLHTLLMTAALCDIEARAMRALGVHIRTMLDAKLHQIWSTLGGGGDQRGRSPVIRSIDVSAELKQQRRTIERATRTSGKQRSPPPRIRGVDVAPCLAEQLHALGMAAHACGVERRAVEPLH